MDENTFTILALRMAERALSVGIGGLAIVLGYRLFMKLPELRPGEGELRLPGGISILVSRVGPGIFFSLFGAVVVALSLWMQVRVGPGDPADPTTLTAAREQVVIAVRPPDEGNAARLRQERIDAERTLKKLEMIPGLLRPDLGVDGIDARNALEAARIALLHSVWGEDWGSFEAFNAWVNAGAGEIPAGVAWRDAAELFRGNDPP